MVFEETVRKQSGKEIPHVLHERQDTLELKDTYIYSGLVKDPSQRDHRPFANIL